MVFQDCLQTNRICLMAKSQQKLINSYVTASHRFVPETLMCCWRLLKLMWFLSTLSTICGQKRRCFRTYVRDHDRTAIHRFRRRPFHTGRPGCRLSAVADEGPYQGWPSVPLELEGMSEIHHRAGLVPHHIDHWDSASQLLSKLPLIGALVRQLMRIFV